MENQKKVLFSYSEFPWEELKSIGLTEESFLDLPKDSIDRIFTGNLSPLMKLKFMDRDGNPMQLPESMKLGQNPDGVVPTKFRLTRDAEGKVHVELHPRLSDISRKIERGKHTTRHVEFLPVGESGFVADTPGFSSFEITRMDKLDTEGYQPLEGRRVIDDDRTPER